MPNINTKQKFLNLKGEIIYSSNDKKREPLELGYVLSEIVLSPNKPKNGFRPLKGWELAKKFYKQSEVEIETADFIQLKELVENNDSFIPMITAQAIEMLNNLK